MAANELKRKLGALRLVGRYTLALVAGAVFAYLAWDPRSTSTKTETVGKTDFAAFGAAADLGRPPAADGLSRVASDTTDPLDVEVADGIGRSDAESMPMAGGDGDGLAGDVIPRE